ncbi:MAG: hypothetical protein P1V97_33755, partial [Planctomycetota bacterium]|nr:hypothetical protein [Planctomycetota bacterium]
DGEHFAIGLDQKFQDHKPDYAIVKKFSDGSIVKTVGPSVQGIHNLVFTKDGKKLVTGSLDGTVAIYELEGQRQTPIRIYDMNKVESFEYLDEKNRPIRKNPSLMTFDEAAGILQRLSGRVAANRQSAGRMGVFSLCLSPNELTLVAGGGDAYCRIFDLEKGGPHKSLPGHDNRIIFSRFIQGGEILITASSVGTIRLWNWVTRHVIRTIKTTLPLISLAVSPNGKRLAGVTSGSVIWVWDVYIPKIRNFRIADADLINEKFPSEKAIRAE